MAMRIRTMDEHLAVEAKWQQIWAQDLTPTRSSTENDDFVMVFPPPNVTGRLHCGHALTTAIQDAIVRYHQMHGKSVRWIPGTDHAGIATQTVVEKQLAKTEGKTRHELGRDAFLSRVWSWKDAHGDHIHHQLRALGASFSWPDAYFTLDAPRSRIVTDAFLELSRRGLIYRATRLVHWCPALETAISDMEVEYLTIDGPTAVPTPSGHSAKVGEMHYFRYPVADATDGIFVTVATTRVETMLGDAAVAVHPTDTRYAHLIGRDLVHPLSGRRIPVVADDHVDPEFGTGAVKITPAHDANDYAIAKRHAIDETTWIDLFDGKGRLTPACGVPELVGVDRFAARSRVVDMLTEAGVYDRVEPHAMRLAVCSRSGDILEPRVVPQWYVRCAPMAQKVLAKLNAGELTLADAWADRELRTWLENMHDWCISRQMWWGHRIPAFRAGGEGEWVVAKEVPNKDGVWVQDEDVLDTWFSSALLPLSATNPDADVTDLKQLVNYPTDLLETGQDILFFWVARMAMLCVELTGQVPFRRVLMHGMVRDAQGRKMSKSLGNVIDPMHVIEGRPLDALLDDLTAGNLPAHEIKRSQQLMRKQFPKGIPSCGADALRLTLLEFASSRQINLDINKVVSNSHVANKLYNTAKFVSQYLPTPSDPTPDLTSPSTPLTLADKWILSRAESAYSTWRASFDHLHVGRATTTAVQFLLEDLSDTYIEWAKPTLPSSPVARAVLAHAFQRAVAMLAPAMPHLASELHGALFDGTRPVARPGIKTPSERDVALFENILSVARAGRKLAPTADRAHALVVVTRNADLATALDEHAALVARRAGKFPSITVQVEMPADHVAPVIVNPDLRVTGRAVAAAPAAAGANAKLVAKLARGIEDMQAMMKSESYAVRVPPAVRERDEKKLASFRERLAVLDPEHPVLTGRRR
ncbi:hypothetical protein GGF31_001102 [Allomyces arbusculus]|nr:hypothetical protein GGF31_001102 [Allomyces arbusculus]